MLFKAMTKPDRQQTQLAYRVKYWPFKELSDAAKQLICFRKSVFFTKNSIETACDEAKITMLYKGREWKIVWAFNNPPTEEEWKRKTDNFNIRAEFRCSAAIPEFAVVILNFELPSDLLRKTYQP